MKNFKFKSFYIIIILRRKIPREFIQKRTENDNWMKDKNWSESESVKISVAFRMSRKITRKKEFRCIMNKNLHLTYFGLCSLLND